MSQLAVYYEHPDWFRPVFAALERRGIPFIRLDAGAHIFDLDEKKPAYDLVFNRASPSGYLRGHLGDHFLDVELAQSPGEARSPGGQWKPGVRA